VPTKPRKQDDMNDKDPTFLSHTAQELFNMPQKSTKHTKISDTLAAELEKNILQGVWAPNEQLPPERDLAASLSTSRPSLREALQKLEKKGLIETRQGGGTVVKDFNANSLTDPLMALFKNHPDTAQDFVEFRAIIEGNAAYYAALRATDHDRALLTACFEAMVAAHGDDDAEDEAAIDADFHLMIAESAHNVVLLHVMQSMVSVLREGVFYNRMQLYTRRGARDLLLEQHRAIYQAIMEGNPDTARQAAKDHLAFVRDVMQDLQREEKRQHVSKQRYERYLEKAAKKKAPARKHPLKLE